MRDADIFNATNHKVIRIDTSKGFDILNDQIDQVVDEIRAAKNSLEHFQNWDIDREQNSQTYIDQGFIKIEDDVAFRYSYQAANCFGHKYSGFQKGGTIHPNEAGKMIWFPKLYPNGSWANSISNDEEVITEISINPERTRSHIDYELKII